MLKLHCVGNQKLNEVGEVVHFGGVNKPYGTDSSGGRWMGVYGWNPARVAQELDVMKSWGVNVVRYTFCYRFWIQNTVDTVSGLGYRTILHDYASLCDSKGIYIIFAGYSVLGYGDAGYRATPIPFPPYLNAEESAVITSLQDWIDCLASMAFAFSDLPNVILESHNEPHGDATAKGAWFNALQLCINAIRQTGFDGLIMYQWDYGTSVNMDYPPQPMPAGGSLNWAVNYPINDPLGNLVVSTHQYRFHRQLGNYSVTYPNAYFYDPKDYEVIRQVLEYQGFQYVLNVLERPIVVGECGLNVFWTGADLEAEITAVTNQLQLYKDLGVDFLGWWWRNILQFQLFRDEANPSGTMTVWGTVFRAALATPTQHTLTVNSNITGVPFNIMKI